MQTKTMTLEQIRDLALRALIAAGTTEANAEPLARDIAATEASGMSSHGLFYLPIYCEHVRCGKVDGQAVPSLSKPRPAFLHVNAGTGFAHPAIDLGFKELIPMARSQGIAGLAVHESYNCGMLSTHTYRLAEAGLIGLGFTNAPASIAPVGGSRPVLGTNPVSMAVPGPDGTPEFVIDQSASAIAKSEVMRHARAGQPIPEGWALDPQGNPTTDAELGLKGSMVPSGGYKGVGIALITETLAAALSGATLGIHASPFSGTAGGPPRTGQFFIAIDPTASGDGFASRISDLTAAIRDQEGARLPGDSRAAKRARIEREGVEVNVELLERINALL